MSPRGLRLLSTVVGRSTASTSTAASAAANQWRLGTCYKTHASAMRLQELTDKKAAAQKPVTENATMSEPPKPQHTKDGKVIYL